MWIQTQVWILGPCGGKNLFLSLSLHSENWAPCQMKVLNTLAWCAWQFLAQQPGWDFGVERRRAEWQVAHSQGSVASVETEGNWVFEDPDDHRAEPALTVAGQWPHLLELYMSCFVFAVLVTDLLKYNSLIM